MIINKNITYLFAHGAGAPCDSEWMNYVSDKIHTMSEGCIEVKRFNFPYMNKRLLENKKYPPNKMPVLMEEWKNQINKCNNSKYLFIGGKSMGGRAATKVVSENLTVNVNGIINFGFPFHAPGKGPGDRIDHLENIKTPCLINQGTRDPMGSKEEILKYKLSNFVEVKYLEDGNHDLKPRIKSGLSFEDNINKAVDNMINFITKICI